MSRDQILKDLIDFPPDDFVAHHIFDRCPAVFSRREDFIVWKTALAKNLDVDPASLILVGSAALGISLNPSKSFKLFDHASDIDVAVVSNYHFQMAWRFLRNNNDKRYRLNTKQRAAWDDQIKRLIFWGTIATDKLLPLMPFAAAWMQAARLASPFSAIADRDIRFRIYADYESLRSYQVNSVKASKGAALTGLKAFPV